jgi:hypothetical protein
MTHPVEATRVARSVSVPAVCLSLLQLATYARRGEHRRGRGRVAPFRTRTTCIARRHRYSGEYENPLTSDPPLGELPAPFDCVSTAPKSDPEPPNFALGAALAHDTTYPIEPPRIGYGATLRRSRRPF